VLEVAPVATKVAVPVAKDAVNDGADVELHTKSVHHGVAVNARGGKGCLVGLENMGAFGRFHGRVQDGVKLDGLFVNLNRHEGPWDKHVVCRRGGGFLADMAMTEGAKGVLKVDGGKPGMQTNWPHKKEQGYDNSPIKTTTNEVFKGSPRE
jgi:hypothetical protein